MINLLSWNIQAAKGVDGVTSVDRIARIITQMGCADVICLQEVLVTAASDQVQQFAALFPDHTPVFGAAIDRLDKHGRLQFGNLVLSRLPMLQIVHHKLPQPAAPSVKHMPRQAIEVIVANGDKPLRIVTTHLDFFSEEQRRLQLAYLLAHHRESQDRYQCPSPISGEAQFAPLPETQDSVYCGDFNLAVESSEYGVIVADPTVSNAENSRSYSLLDCWRYLHPDKPHAPTCGIFDSDQWPEGAHCRDYFFASSSVASCIKNFQVDVDTDASDHQPLSISLDEGRGN
ncbi:MAG: endonuclease/exonuclease/phosphatase family protein [Granulosicoccus sp.]|nr:endonuclease/exonuclease/phosphatase family protein [Granulosicoccus sp.]